MWLGISNVSGGLAHLNLNNATDAVYKVISKNSLSVAGSWNIEGELWPVNGQTNVMPFTVAGSPTNLFIWAMDWTGVTSDGNETPEWWFWKYFGTVDLSDTNLDSTGENTLLVDYTYGLDPNVIQFSLQFTNNYVNSSLAYGSVTIQGGVPGYEAILVNDTNLADASWQPYTSTNVLVNLNSGDGLYNVLVGLRGLPSDATPTWVGTQLTLNTVAPVLTVTNPASGSVSVPMIQLQGYVNESLGKLTFDVSNATGVFTNQTGYWQPVFYDTNLLEFTTNTFQCYDIPLTNGVNKITLHATDVEGNAATTNFSYTLSYAGVTNAPTLSILWPQNNTAIGGGNVTIQAQVSDATATVTASANGSTVQGLVERSGLVWLQNVPLSGGTNVVTIIAANAAGKMSTNSLNVVQSSVSLTINPLPTNELNQSSVTVTGTISDGSLNVWVNGVQATVSGDPVWEATNVPVSPAGTAIITVQAGVSITNILTSGTLNQSQPALALVSDYDATGHYVWITTNAWGQGDGVINETNLWNYLAGGPWLEDDTFWVEEGEWFGYGAYTNSPDGGIDGWQTPTPEYAALNGSEAVRQVKTRVIIDPPDQSAAGGTALYVVRASASEVSPLVRPYDTDLLDTSRDHDLIFDLIGTDWYAGSLPLPAEWLRINGQTLTNGVTTNVDGSIWGSTLVSAASGATVDVTPVAARVYTNWDYTFDVQAQEVALQSLTVVSNSATQIDATNWATVKSPTNDYVIVQAALNFTNDWILTNAASLIQWTGGEPVAGNPLQRMVTKTNSVETTVNASLGGYSTNLNVWVIWATISFAMSGTNPSPISFDPFGLPGNQLGVIYYLTNTFAVGKMCAIATITPAGAHTVVLGGWDINNQQRMAHCFANGAKDTSFYETVWTPDSTAVTNTLDANDKIYLIDAPSIGNFASDSYEKYVNFYDQVKWNSQPCSDTNNFWHFQGRWKADQTPQVTFTDLGTGLITLPTNSYYPPP